MYELIQVTEHCYYIQSPAKVGLVQTGDTEVCLIDSGNDKDAGKKIKRILDDRGWTLKAIYNTHSHADHIGGNACLQKQTGCRIYAPGIERDFTEHPILEPAFLYGGNPLSELKHKFLMAQGSSVLAMTQECLPEGMTAIPLPGHSWDMTGFRTADGAFYLADCLSSEQTLQKYGVTFLVDVEAALSTLEAVRQMKGTLFIPAHADPTEDPSGLAEMNIAKIHEIASVILTLCREPISFDTILQGLFAHYQLTMTFEQHALLGSTLRSYLTWLHGQGRLRAEIGDNRILWRA